MAYIVQGTSAGGTTVVDRDTAERAYDTASEMHRAGYADIAVTDPDGEQHTGSELSLLISSLAPGPGSSTWYG